MKDIIDEQGKNTTSSVLKAAKASSLSNSHAGSANSKGDSSSRGRRTSRGGISQKKTPPQRTTSSNLTHATKSAPQVPEPILTFPTDHSGPGPPFQPQMMMTMTPGGWGHYPPSYFIPTGLHQMPMHMGPAIVMSQAPGMMPYAMPMWGGQHQMASQYLQPGALITMPPPPPAERKIEPEPPIRDQQTPSAPPAASITEQFRSLKPSDQQDGSCGLLPHFASTDLLNSLFNKWNTDGLIQEEANMANMANTQPQADIDLQAQEKARVKPFAQLQNDPAADAAKKKRQDEEDEEALLSAEAWGEDWMKEAACHDDEDMNDDLADINGVAGLDASLVDMDPDAYMVGERGMGIEEDPFMQQRMSTITNEVGGFQQGLMDWWRSSHVEEMEDPFLGGRLSKDGLPDAARDQGKGAVVLAPAPAVEVKVHAAEQGVKAKSFSQAPQASVPAPTPIPLPQDFSSAPAQQCGWSDFSCSSVPGVVADGGAMMTWQAQYNALQQQQMAMMAAMSSGGAMMSQMQMMQQMQASLQKQQMMQMQASPMMAQVPYMMAQQTYRPYQGLGGVMMQPSNHLQRTNPALGALGALPQGRISLVVRSRREALQRYQEKKKTRSIGRIIYEKRQVGAMTRPRAKGRFSGKDAPNASVEAADAGVEGDDEEEEEGEDAEVDAEVDASILRLDDSGLVLPHTVVSLTQGETRASHPALAPHKRASHGRGDQEVERVSSMLRDVGHAVGLVLVQKHEEGKVEVPVHAVAEAVAAAVDPFLVNETLSLGLPAVAVYESPEGPKGVDGGMRDGSVDQPCGKRSRQS